MAKPRGFSSGFAPGFGVGRYRYVLTPWVWETSIAGMPHWRLPNSSVGGVDLRPLPAQGIAGGTPQGFAFATTMQPVDGVEVARSLHFGQEAVTTLMRDAWASAMTYRPDGINLVDLLWDQLTAGSDPDGIDGPKPLMPGTDGMLKLFVGGHSLVKQERFRFGVHPHTGKVRDLLQRQFAESWERTNGADHCRRVLDYTCEKYRVEDWREFVPANLRAHVPGRLKHATTITDDFNRSDAGSLGTSAGGWSWAEVVGSWAIASNVAFRDDATTDGVARAESDLSSDDHYGQVVASNLFAESYAAGVARLSSSATTYYVSIVNQEANRGLWKVVSGAFTRLATPATEDPNNKSQKTEADGSTIKGYSDGVEVASSTDTAITGNLRTGMTARATNNIADNFEAADLAVGSDPQTVTLTPVSAAWSVVAPAVNSAATIAPAPVTAAWSVVAPTISVPGASVISLTPITAAWSVAAPAILAASTISLEPVSAAWSIAAPTVNSAATISLTPLVATWSVVGPAFVTAVTIQLTPVAVQWAVAEPVIFATGDAVGSIFGGGIFGSRIIVGA